MLEEISDRHRGFELFPILQRVYDRLDLIDFDRIVIYNDRDMIGNYESNQRNLVIWTKIMIDYDDVLYYKFFNIFHTSKLRDLRAFLYLL